MHNQETIFLENGCKDELSADLCLNIKESGSCEIDMAKTHCKKTCDNCEDEGRTLIPCKYYSIDRLIRKSITHHNLLIE